MKRIIVDYKKLTPEILSLLVEKYPDGYDDNHIISFKNAKNEWVDCVEVKTDDTVYLVKVSARLEVSMANFDEDDYNEDEFTEPISELPEKDSIDPDLDLDEDTEASGEEEDEEKKHKNNPSEDEEEDGDYDEEDDFNDEEDGDDGDDGDYKDEED
ncbi:MAG: DNA primase [Flavobacteriaceae bacterium]|nr:DNA primase [Flavobacteriaceae bacterium]